MSRWAAVAGVLVLVGACREERYDQLEQGGVLVERVEASRAPAVPGGQALVPGDFVIEGDELRVVVGGMRRGGDARGSVLEALHDEAPAEDGIVSMVPRLRVGSRSLPVLPTEMYVVDRGSRPALRVVGEVRVEERTLEVIRELTVADVSVALSVRTRVETTDGEPLSDVRFEERVSWGGARPYLPGVGEMDDAAWHDAAWTGRAGSVASTVFGFDDAPQRVRAVFERHGASRFLTHTSIASPKVRIPADEPRRSRSALVVASGGLSEAVRRLGWVRGRPFPEALFVLPHVPSGARIHVETGAGRPAIATRPDDEGEAVVPLTPIAGESPEGSWLARATAYGHAPSEPVWFEVRDGSRARLEIPRGGRILVRALDAAADAVLPARVRIQGVAGTGDPDLGPVHRAAGAATTVVTTAGEATIPVAPGRYRVVVSHGPEWSLATETVEVTETFRPEVEARLRRVVDPGDWVPCDFHLHAAPSNDSQVSLEDRVASLVAEGIRFAVPTDHNHVTDYAPTIAELEVEGLGTVPGVEVTTWDPAYGHFNAFPFPVDADQPAGGAPEYRGTTPGRLFDALHEVGEDVLVQVNHPRMEHDIGYFEMMGLDARTGAASDAYSADFDALEVWNGFDLSRMEMFDRVLADWLALLGRGRRIVATGSSDSHQVSYQWAGYPRTYVHVAGGSVDDPGAVIASLAEGHAFVTSGPLLEVRVGEAGPGETARVRRGPVRGRVSVQAAPWMEVSRLEVHAGRAVVLERSLDGTDVDVESAAAADVEEDGVGTEDPGADVTSPPAVRFEGDLEVNVGRARFMVVVVRGERGLESLLGRPGIPPLAFTNPIWIERRSPGRPAGWSDAGAGDSGQP